MEHELYLARLEWELTQRKQLAEQCNSFEEEKKQLATGVYHYNFKSNNEDPN